MKTLTLLRHAKSGDDGLVARDFDRRLNAKGRRAAAAIGLYCREQGLGFDAVIASPAARVQETLEEVADAFGTALQPRFDRRLYLASVDDLLDVVQGAPAGIERLLVAGHNPGLERLVLALVPESPDGPRGAVEEKYPTASLAEIAFNVGAWPDVAPGGGHLARFVRPRDLDPTLGPDEG